MDFRERALRSFQKRKIDEIVWRPRICYWYYGNRLKNKLPNAYKGKSLFDSLYENILPHNGNIPKRFRDKSMIEIYYDLNASPRYPQEVLGINGNGKLNS